MNKVTTSLAIQRNVSKQKEDMAGLFWNAAT
jgi:hypothetical protein